MRPSVHVCLLNALKFTNWVLLVTGLAVALIAAFVLLEFERAQARDAADAPTPPPPTPPPAPGLPEAPPTSEIARVLASEPWYDRVSHRRLFTRSPRHLERVEIDSRFDFSRTQSVIAKRAPAKEKTKKTRHTTSSSRARVDPSRHTPAPHAHTRRFLWAFMCTGGYLFVTCVVGLSGVDFAARCRCGISAHRHMLLIAAAAQLAVCLALALDTHGANALADLDITGAEAKLSRAVHAHLPLARGVSLAVFALQLVDLSLATALAHAPAPAANGEEEDEEAAPPSTTRRGGRFWERKGGRNGDAANAETASRGASLRGGRSRGGNRNETETDPFALGAPLLDHGDDDDADDVGAHSDAESESAVWARRMRSKYNLDVTRLAYDSERVAQPPRPGADREREEGKCVVM